MSATEKFLNLAIELAQDNILQNGRPFGAVLVKDGQILATGVNETVKSLDPTDHAELLAIRKASQILKSPRLDGCVVYASGNPCPMCLSAMYLTGIKEVYFAYSNAQGEKFGLSTEGIYQELKRPFSEQAIKIIHHPVTESGEPLYERWNKIH